MLLRFFILSASSWDVSGNSNIVLNINKSMIRIMKKQAQPQILLLILYFFYDTLWQQKSFSNARGMMPSKMTSMIKKLTLQIFVDVSWSKVPVAYCKKKVNISMHIPKVSAKIVLLSMAWLGSCSENSALVTQ